MAVPYPGHEVGLQIARNLSRAMSQYGRACANGSVVKCGDEAILIDSGLDYAVFNAAVVHDPMQEGIAGLRGFLKSAAAHYRARNTPWSCWLCSSLFEATSRLELRGVLLQHGLRLAAIHDGMFASQVLGPTQPSATFMVRPVNDDKTRRDLCVIAERVFAVPRSYARSIYAGDGFWSDGYRAWLGYSNGQPVATAATETAEGTVGLYCVATMPEARRKGFAGAVSAHAIRQAQAESGFRTAILHSTPEGLPLYRRMGFETVTRHEVFVSA